MSGTRRGLSIPLWTLTLSVLVVVAGCGGARDGRTASRTDPVSREQPASKTLTGTVNVAHFVVRASERVAWKGDVVVLCQTAEVKGALGAERATAAGQDGGGLVIKADKAITVSGKIVAGSGVSGRDAAHEVTSAGSSTYGGSGGSVELNSLHGDVTLARGARLAAGDGGAGGLSLAGGAGGHGGSIILRATQGTVKLVQGPKLFHVGNGGSGGNGEVQGADLLTFELPSTLANAGGDSGALRVYCHGLVGPTPKASSQPHASPTLLIATLDEGVADGGSGGDAGAYEYGGEAAIGRSTWPALPPRDKAAQDPPRPLQVKGARGGDGWERGGAGSLDFIVGKDGLANKPGADVGAVGGLGGSVTLEAGTLAGRLLSIEGPRVKVGGKGGNAYAWGGKGGARTSCGLGLPGGSAKAQGGAGGDVDIRFPARYRKPGTGGEGGAHGGKGGPGGSCCETTPKPGEKGGLGGDAEAWGGPGGNDGEGQGGPAKAEAGSGGLGGTGLPEGPGGNPGQCVAHPGRGKPLGKTTASPGRYGKPGERCPGRFGVMTGHSEKTTLTINSDWFEYPRSTPAAAPAIHDHPNGSQGLVLNRTNTKLWIASTQARVNVYTSPLSGNHLTPNWSLTRTGGSDETHRINLWLDASRDMLYATGYDDTVLPAKWSLLVWHHASTPGNHAAAREITLNGALPVGVTGDAAHDRLFVVTEATPGNTHAVAVLDHASTRNGTVTPDRTLTGLPGYSSALACDPGRDLLYVGWNAGLALVKNASTAHGALAPTLVTGAHTGIQERPAAFCLFPESDLLFVADFDHDLLVFEDAHALAGNAPFAKRQNVGQWLSAMTAWREG